MSTTFGIAIPTIKYVEEIAFRHGIGQGLVQINILNPLIFNLPENTPVIALDNTNQGINTIGDIIHHNGVVLTGNFKFYGINFEQTEN